MFTQPAFVFFVFLACLGLLYCLNTISSVLQSNSQKSAALIIAFAIISIFFWYATYSTKSGFAIDQNNNQIPDKWEKVKIIFKLKSLVYLTLGFLLGYVFHYLQFNI